MSPLFPHLTRQLKRRSSEELGATGNVSAEEHKETVKKMKEQKKEKKKPKTGIYSLIPEQVADPQQGSSPCERSASAGVGEKRWSSSWRGH